MGLSDTNKCFIYFNLCLNEQMMLKGQFRQQAKMYFEDWNRKSLRMYKEISKNANVGIKDGSYYMDELTCNFSEISDLILNTDVSKWEEIKEFVKNLK